MVVLDGSTGIMKVYFRDNGGICTLLSKDVEISQGIFSLRDCRSNCNRVTESTRTTTDEGEGRVTKGRET